MDRFLEMYGAVGPIAAVGQIVYLAVALWLGLRLVALSRRTGGLPERLLGLHLLLSLGVGYALLSTGVGVAQLVDDPPRQLVAPLLGVGFAVTICGLVATLVFTALVFHAGQRGARWLATGLSLCLVAGWALHGATGGFARGTFEGRGAWLLLGSMLATNAWVAFEPLRYHGQLRRRIPLGLAEPIVANRMLLWGLGSLARVVMVLLAPASESALRHLEGAAHDAVAPLTLGLASLLGVGISVAFWLSFAPPPAYVRRVEAHSARRMRSA